MLISISIETVCEVYATMSTIISIVEGRNAKVEVVAVRIAIPDAHSPSTSRHIDGAIEVVACHKPTILATAKHIHQVLVAHIEQIVVIVDGIVVAIYHIVNNLVCLIEEVEVYLIHIFILSV
jgi:hypothetical protein